MRAELGDRLDIGLRRFHRRTPEIHPFSLAFGKVGSLRGGYGFFHEFRPGAAIGLHEVHGLLEPLLRQRERIGTHRRQAVDLFLPIPRRHCLAQHPRPPLPGLFLEPLPRTHGLLIILARLIGHRIERPLALAGLGLPMILRFGCHSFRDPLYWFAAGGESLNWALTFTEFSV